MNELKNVTSKLFKNTNESLNVELESHKVDLSNLDNLKKIIDRGRKIYDRGVVFIDKKTALQKEAKTLNADSKALLSGGEKMVNDFIKTAKDLGIDINSIKEVEEAINTLGVLNTVFKQSEQL
jgi:hypothetical protein